MKKNLKKELKLKDGTIYAKGTPAEIRVEESQPMNAILTIGSREITIRSTKLFRYFPGFVNPIEEMKDPDYEYDTTVMASLTGKMVEPDGWDDKGFPSVLLSLGLI